jgi:hypothetical protein
VTVERRLADVLITETAVFGSPTTPQDIAELARIALDALVGTDDHAGVLDAYAVVAPEADCSAYPVVMAFCGRPHEDGRPWLGLAAGDRGSDQSDLTLGKFVRQALDHESDQHSGA